MTVSVRAQQVLAWLMILSLWAALHGMLSSTVAGSVYQGELLGPDGYMRLIRAAELRDGGNWFDIVIERSNAPYGDALHWTRPMDLLILGFAGLLAPFADAEDALFISGAASSPLVALLACIAMAWAARPVVGPARALLAVFILLLQPAVLSYTMAGRADHHSLQLLVFIFCIGATLRLLQSDPPKKIAVLAGIGYGFALWISIELLLLIALCQTALGLHWLRNGGRAPIRAEPALRTAAAFLATTATVLTIERPPSGWLVAEQDRISIVHLGMAGIFLGFWAVLRLFERRGDADPTARRKALVAGAAAAVGFAVLIAVFPETLAGPFAAVDPRILPIWHEQVAELKPLTPTDMKQLGLFLFFIGAGVPALIFLAVVAWRERNDATGARRLFPVIVLVVYFTLALKHLRLAPFAEIAYVWALTEMVGRFIAWSDKHLSGFRQFAVKYGATFLVILGPLMAGMFLIAVTPSAEADDANPECRISHVAPLLSAADGLGAQPLTIGGLLDYGPEILFRTPHAVISAPYHRNGDGIWDSYRLLAASNESESRAIVARRGIDLIVICPSTAERSFYLDGNDTGNLYSRLLDGDIPSWMRPVPADATAMDGFRVFRVDR